MATRVNTATALPDATVPTMVTSATTEPNIPKWQLLAPLAVTVVLALLPAPPGLAHFAWLYFSIFAGVIVGLIFEPLPGAAIALIGLTLVTVLAPFALFSPGQLAQPGFRPASAAIAWALSGYSNPTVWLILGAFLIALGYDKTGLGHRIALVIVKKMGRNTLLLGYGITLADTILAPFIPVAGSSTQSRATWRLITGRSPMTHLHAGSAHISCGSPSPQHASQAPCFLPEPRLTCWPPGS